MPIKKTRNITAGTADKEEQLEISFFGFRIKCKNPSPKGVTIFISAIVFFLVLLVFFPKLSVLGGAFSSIKSFFNTAK